MPRPLKPATTHREIYLTMAINLLQVAMGQAQKAHAPGTVKAIRRALDRATRAQRRMGRRRRTEKDTP